jgi:hypothetical protein
VNWTKTMYLWSVVGGVASLLWPILLALFVKQVEVLDLGAGSRILRRLSAFGKKVVAFVVLLLLTVILASIAAAVGFFAFVNNEPNKSDLMKAGTSAYFAAFTYGFSAVSLAVPTIVVRKRT